MARSAPSQASTATAARLAAFVVERFPFAIEAVQQALSFGEGRVLLDPASLREHIQRGLRKIDVAEVPETTPGVTAEERWNAAVTELLDAIDGFMAREALVLAMRNDPWTIRMILNAQIGKDGPPMNGRDIHVAAWEWGVFPPTAPLGINAVNIAGVAMAFARERSDRVAISLMGEGGSSL